MSVCGIDFGNLSMLIAHAAKGGVDLILNDASMRQTATAVSFQGKQRFVGDAAAALARTNVRGTLTCMKLLVGRNYDDADVQRELSKHFFSHSRLPHGGVGINVTYNDQQIIVPVEQLFAIMLVKAQQIGMRANGVGLADCCLAVPAWFTESQRRGILNACEIADLNCLKLMNESTAVALSYGIYKSAKKLFSETEAVHTMFIDIGYSCYTVTIADFIQEKLQIRSTVCERELGGRDFDNVIVQYLIEHFKSKTGIDVSNNAKALLKLQAAAEKAKQTLSPAGVTDANVSVECLAEERDLSCVVKRDEFETRCAALVAKLRGPIEACLAEAGLAKSDISDCEIVGGSSRVNIVKRTLSEILGLDASLVNYGLKTTMNSDEAVSRGATLQCAIVSSRIKVKPFNIIDKVYYPIVVEYEKDVSSSSSSKIDDTEDDAVDNLSKLTSSHGNMSTVEIYSRSDDYPRKARRLVFHNKTSSFTIQTFYGPNANLPNGQSNFIGRYLIKIPENFHSSPHDVRVTFTMDKHQVVTVQSAELMEELPPLPKPDEKEEKGEGGAGAGTGDIPDPPETKKRFRKVELEVVIENFGLTRQQVKDCIQSEAEMSLADKIIIETSDKRNELEAYIYSMRDKLDGELKPYVTNSNKIQFKELIDRTETWLYDEGFDCTKSMYASKLDGLRKFGDPIEKRMYEEVNRKEACDALKKQIELVKAFVNNRDEAFAHVTAEERTVVRNEAESTEQWFYDELEKQGNLSSFDDPILTVDILQAKRKALYVATNGTMNKPKPKPVPKEEKKDSKEEQAKGDNNGNGDGKSDDHSDSKSSEDKDGPAPMEECN